jgi:hypothetical protein
MIEIVFTTAVQLNLFLNGKTFLLQHLFKL